MTWMKVPSEAWTDPVFRRLGAVARDLHLRAVSYVLNENSGNPLIPRNNLGGLAPRSGARTRAINRLVERGLWDRLDTHYRIVYLMADQPSQEEVVHRRERDRFLQERHRRHMVADHSKCDPRRCEFLLGLRK